MKIFDYLCPSCNKVEERWVKDPDKPQICSCGEEMKRQLAIPAMVFTETGGRTVTKQ